MYTFKILMLILSNYLLSVLFTTTINCLFAEAYPCSANKGCNIKDLPQGATAQLDIQATHPCSANKGCNFSIQDWPKDKHFQANVQIFNFYGPNEAETKDKPSNNSKAEVTCKKKCVIPEDYKITKYIGAHKFHKQPVVWDVARQICISEGAHLGVFSSMSEIYLFNEMMKAHNEKDVWLGYHDLFKEGKWTNVLDVPMSSVFVNWKPGDPNNWNIENCAFLEYTRMLDVKCDSLISFICKISIDDCDFDNESNYSNNNANDLTVY